jgi:hypothetical protein
LDLPNEQSEQVVVVLATCLRSLLLLNLALDILSFTLLDLAL